MKRRLIISFLAVVLVVIAHERISALHAQSTTGSTGNIVKLDVPEFHQSAIVISDHGKLVVEIGMDGSVKYGPGFKADKAAKEFWEAVSKAYPICKTQK